MPIASQDSQKRSAAARAVSLVSSGMKLGLGTGSTAAHFVDLLGERVRSGPDVICVATPEATRARAERQGLRITTLDQTPRLDLTIDGADEIDPELRLIKGGGGALLREKIVASASRKFVIIADSSKQVPVLGRFPVPVEVISFAQSLVATKIALLGASVGVRSEPSGQPFITDEGHRILDCNFGPISDPPALARALEALPGAVEHGLFIDMATIAAV